MTAARPTCGSPAETRAGNAAPPAALTVVGWTKADMPSLAGRRAIVTGATSGIGFETALALAAAGAQVLIAARDPAKAERAIFAIRAAHPTAKLAFDHLDTGELSSVSAFAARRGDEPPVDLLILNAGIAWLPQREATPDGFERQFAVNYLGHFALAGLLLPRLRPAPGTRIVPVASLAHRRGRLAFDDLQFERGYSPAGAYRQSKLAMLMFGLELDRRLRAAGSSVRTVPAHPGWAVTGIHRRGGRASLSARLAGRAVFAVLGQSAARGALPILYAATSPKAEGGRYYGPGGLGEMRGAPAEAVIARHAADRGAAERLFATSERLTGTTFAF